MGDVIHNLPIIHDIHSHLPDMEIDWLVEETFADIPAMHPGIENVISIAIRRWRKNLFKLQTWQEIVGLRKRLKQTHYDLVLDTQGLIKSALAARLANPPWHGYIRNSIREPIAALFYTHSHTVSKNLHAVARNRELAAKALGYAIPQSPPEYGLDANLPVTGIELPERYVVGLHATSRDSKLWPETHWIALGEQLVTRGLNLLLPWGSQQELARARRLAAKISGAVVLPKLRIASLGNILQGAHAAVGVDTGLVHLAVALGIPTIAIYTDTDPGLTGTLAGAGAMAINLGGIHQTPGAAQVMERLSMLRIF